MPSPFAPPGPGGPAGVTERLEGWSKQGRTCGIPQLWSAAVLGKEGEWSHRRGFAFQSGCLKSHLRTEEKKVDVQLLQFLRKRKRKNTK